MKKLILILLSSLCIISLVGCANSNTEYLTEKEFEESNNEMEYDSESKTLKREVEECNNENFDSLKLINKSITITDDEFFSSVLIEEFFYININMDELIIRCSKADFEVIKNNIEDYSITLVYEPLDYEEYETMYEGEHLLLAYKINK